MSNNNQLPPIIESSKQPILGSSGFFLPGTQACFFFTFTDISGHLYDPFDIDILIQDSDGNELVSSDAADKLELGKWSFVFVIPKDTNPGKYVLTLTYTTETLDGPQAETFTEEFIIGELKSGQNAYTVRQIASRAFLESLIGYTQRIPIFNETVRFSRDRKTGGLSFPRWNQTAGTRVYLNGELIDSSLYSVDYWRGRILFNNALGGYDEVWTDYNFRWFTDSELDSFIEIGVNEVNIHPPQTSYTINNIEDRWVVPALYSAAVNVLRRWLMDIQFAEPAKIFGTLQRAQDVFGNMHTLKKNYEDEKNKLLEQKKYGPYVGLTKTVTTPEFTLPGGRSRWFRYLFKGA